MKFLDIYHDDDDYENDDEDNNNNNNNHYRLYSSGWPLASSLKYYNDHYFMGYI